MIHSANLININKRLLVYLYVIIDDAVNLIFCISNSTKPDFVRFGQN